MNALLVIDMQDAYFKTPELLRQKSSLVEAINQAATKARQADEPIIAIRTVHRTDKSTWTLNMLEDDKGFAFDGSAETQLVDGLELADALEIIKTRDSAFHETELLHLLRSLGVTQLTLTGVSAHSCIFHTAAAAYAYDFPVTLLRAGIGDESQSALDEAFEYLKREYRQTVA